MHVRSRKPLQDTLTATRLAQPVAACGLALEPNAEAHLRSRQRLAALYEPAWLEQTLVLAGTCSFSLDELRYEYPQEIVPPGETPTSHLRKLTYAGVPKRFPGGLSDEYRAQIESELALIEQLKYEPYFLTVADIVAWAREQKILCQGRGSAANSLVCYCLHVTEVDPRRATLLFGRFISAERNEPPDIDIDFEHQRREEVIQYIYGKYGRQRAALTAVVISYRPRSALRDVGRALGIDLQRIDGVAKSQQWFDGRRINPERLRENGFDPESPICQLWAELTQQLVGFPRHLSQHPGGFVIAKERMAELVPVENASMPDRSVIQWNKDDLDELGLLKVDILALGMLSAIRRALEFMRHKLGREVLMQHIPDDDVPTYDMICASDTVGVFQIESRAQMSMLPRLKPRCYYDLVVEVAIVRPGPIQGGMVHPYLKNRTLRDDEIDCPEELKPALMRTKGVPIFQEQVMQIAMLAADFTAGEADALRRAMAAWKRKGGLGPFHERLVGRMVEKGYERDYAERIFKQIEGFGEYGFPESHAAGFALLAYVSSWIKCHHPDAFLAGLLNSQPMGFYAPAQLVRDARAHGVEVLPVDVRCSAVQSTLVPPTPPSPGTAASPAASPPPSADARLDSPLQAVRLGFDRISGLSTEAAERIVEARDEAPFESPEDLASRARLNAHELAALAQADALQGLTGHRHQAAWAVAGIDTRPTPMLRETRVHETAAHLPAPSEAEDMQADYRMLGLTPEAPSARAAAPELAKFRIEPACGAAHLSARPAGARERPRHAPPAPRDGQGHRVRDARGRDRLGQHHRLGLGRRCAAEAAARRDPAHRLRPVAAPGRRRVPGDAPARDEAGRSLGHAAGPRQPQPRLPLTSARRAAGRYAVCVPAARAGSGRRQNGAMTAQPVTPELRHWILAQAAAGQPTEALVKAMRASGWSEDAARRALQATLNIALPATDATPPVVEHAGARAADRTRPHRPRCRRPFGQRAGVDAQPARAGLRRTAQR